MSYYPDYDVYDVTLDDGKYHFVSVINREYPDVGPTRTKCAWRNGEWWPNGEVDMRNHGKSDVAILMELHEAREALHTINECMDPAVLVRAVGPKSAELVFRAMTRAAAGRT